MLRVVKKVKSSRRKVKGSRKKKADRKNRWGSEKVKLYEQKSAVFVYSTLYMSSRFTELGMTIQALISQKQNFSYYLKLREAYRSAQYKKVNNKY